MERAVARASQAYRDNQVALDDAHLPEDHSIHHSPDTAAHIETSARSARNLHHVKSAKNLRTAAAVTVNLRDCGTISRILRQGRMFRSSQVMRYSPGPFTLPIHSTAADHQLPGSALPVLRFCFIGLQCSRDRQARHQGELCWQLCLCQLCCCLA